jgi:hypothetical protein
LRLAGLSSFKNAVLAPSRSVSGGKTAAEADSAVERRSIRPWLPIGSLVVLYIALATAYNIRVPLYEAPDEHSHVAYVDHLQKTGEIPDIPRIYEAAGPPLYHAIGAAVLKVVGFQPPYIGLPENPNWMTEKNHWLHVPTENDFPYRGPVLGIHVLRGISTLFGAGTVVLVYLITLLLFPERRLLAWGAAANTALLPMFAFVGGSVMNDTALAFFGAAAVYSILRVVKSGEALWVGAAAVSLGLGFLTEGSMIVVAVVCALALLFSPLSWRSRGFALAALVAVPLIVAGWFYVRSIILFGDVYPADELTGDGPPRALDDLIYREVFFDSLQESYWYVGGWMNVRLAGGIYQFLNVVAGMALAGVIVTILRNRLTGFQLRALFLMGALFIAAMLEVMYVNVQIGLESQGRFLFVAQPAIALLFALGINALFQRNQDRDNFSLVLLPAFLLALNIGILTLRLPDVY